MRLVDRAVTAPSRCAVIPFLGATHEGGFVDTGAEMPSSAIDQHVYVSVVAVKEMAGLIGWESGEAVAELRAELEAARERIAALEREVAEADVVLRAIDTLESADFRARKKPGRPRKTEEEVAA